MKTFKIDKELEEILVGIGKTFNHKDIYETVFNGFLFLRFLEDIKKNDNKLFLQYKDGKTIELPVSDLLAKNVDEKKTENKTKIIR